jgi:hypothetical protein
MARFSVSGRTTIVGTSALPNVSLYATAAVRPRVVEIGLFNTSSTACVVALVRLTTAGTQGTGLTEVAEDSPDHTALATAFAGHTVGPTIGGELRRASLGAAIGSGVIWTFSGLEIPAGTGNGVGIIVPTGTGQTLDYSIAWEE